MASPTKPKSKRPCCSSPDPNLNIDHMKSNLNPFDSLLESFLGLSDASSISLDLSLDRLLESRPSDIDRNDMIERALKLGSVLLEAGKRSARKRDSMHNGLVWALPPDLTIKVFSMLDTRSVCYASATCSFFHKCASDSSCYANLDLTTEIPKVNNMVVSTMIQRAGKYLRSLKLGIVPGSGPGPTASFGSSQALAYSMRISSDVSGFSWTDKRSRQGKESCVLSRSCLAPLSADGCSMGFLLKRLHLYNIERMDNTAVCTALLSCPSLLDLEIVGLHVELTQTLESVSKYCPLLERLSFESSKTGRDDSLKLPTCTDLVTNCPNISYLALKGFKIHDYAARVLVKGCRKLKYVDFSTSYSITGAFLKNVGANLLEILILRDCVHLKEMEVARFVSAILGGDFKKLRHLDISNREGLASEGDWCRRVFDISFIPVAELFKERPDFCLLAEFPSCPIEIEQMSGSDINSDISSPSISDGSLSMSSFTSGDSSDQGSGNDDAGDSGFAVFNEISDDVDFSLV